MESIPWHFRHLLCFHVAAYRISYHILSCHVSIHCDIRCYTTLYHITPYHKTLHCFIYDTIQIPVSVNKNTPFLRVRALQPGGRNCNPDLDLALWKLTFQCLLSSGGMFFAQTPVWCYFMFHASYWIASPDPATWTHGWSRHGFSIIPSTKVNMVFAFHKKGSIIWSLAIFMETGWPPQEGHPYYSMAIIILLSDIRHLIIT